LLHLLSLADRELAERFTGPLPLPGLEGALAAKLGEVESLDNDLAVRQVRPIGSSVTNDPAEDQDLLRRLEFLVSRLLGRAWEEPLLDGAAGGRSGGKGQRQTFGLCPREVRVRWKLPADLADDLRFAVQDMRAKHPNVLPTWLALTLLFDEAGRHWNAHDPAARPVWWRILERDEYFCQVPGCTRRGNLTVHHIRFRSRGGSHRAWNLVVLCHACHLHLLHAGWIRLWGQAPSNLHWEIGLELGSRPILRLFGERILERAWG
jgi:hypothetical protein